MSSTQPTGRKIANYEAFANTVNRLDLNSDRFCAVRPLTFPRPKESQVPNPLDFQSSRSNFSVDSRLGDLGAKRKPGEARHSFWVQPDWGHGGRDDAVPLLVVRLSPGLGVMCERQSSPCAKSSADLTNERNSHPVNHLRHPGVAGCPGRVIPHR